MEGEVLASADFNFEIENKARKTLVAVLDVEAGFFNQAERRSLSDYLRGQLTRHSNFNIASAADVDKFDPDEIQKQTGCTRDECAVAIGEQMGVDRVISTSIQQLSDTSWFIASKLTNIQTSENLIISTREYKGAMESISSMFPVLNEMALELSGKRTDTGGSLFGQNVTGGFSGQASIQRITPKVTGNKKSKTAALFLNTQPKGAEVYIGNLMLGKTPFQNLKMTPGKTLLITFKHDDYLDKRIELTLSGGVNRTDPIPLQTRYGHINITSEPEGAEVTIAGQMIGRTPIVNHRIASGKYLMSLSKEFYFSEENQQVVVEPGKALNKNYQLRENFGTLSLQSAPTETSYSILNEQGEVKKQGRTPDEFRIDAGKYRVRLEQEGYETLDFQIAVPLGKKIEITPKEAKLRQLKGTLIVSSEPYEDGAEVFFNGKSIGHIPGEFELPVGEHTLRVESGLKNGSMQVNIKDQEIQTVAVPIMNKFTRDEMETTHSLWTAGLYGSFGGGLALMAYAMNENSAVEASNQEKQKYLNLAASATTREESQVYLGKAQAADNDANTHASNTQTGILLSAGAFALWGYLYANEPPNPDQLSWIPITDGKTYGIAMQNRF